MARIKITESQFKELIDNSVKQLCKWKYYNNFRKYKEEYPDDTFEFCRFPKYITGLPVEILLDDNANYVHCNHPLWVYMSNGMNGKTERLIPISVHRFKPCVLDGDAKISISNNDLHEVFDFIKKNYYTIVEYANARITYDEVEDVFLSKSVIAEAMLNEMPTFDKTEVNLPTDIWIDGERNLQHNKRIKFRDRPDTRTKTWATMTIDKFNPEIRNLYKKTFLSPKDISLIKDFVKVNYETLMLAANGQLPSKSDILANLNIDTDIMSLLKFNEKVNIEISGIKNRLYFLTNGDDDKSLEFISRLSKIKPFKSNDEYSVYLNLYDIDGNPQKKKQIILSTLKNLAKKIHTKLNIINTNILDEIAQILKYFKNEKYK